MPFEFSVPSTFDILLLQKLGIPSWKCPFGEEVHVADVKINLGQPSDMAATISIYVRNEGSQAFRLEILRPSESREFMEIVTLSTGTGTLQQFWPVAVGIAKHDFEVGPARRVETQHA
jgi:hypothetical protein